MTFYGEVEYYLPDLQEDFAPGVDIIRVVNGSCAQTTVLDSYDTTCLADHPWHCDCLGDRSRLGNI